MDLPPEELSLPSKSTAALGEDIQQQRRDRREARKKKRKEDKLKQQVEALRAPQSKKVTVITKRTFEKLQVPEDNKLQVKNKLFQASKSSFALTDFLVARPKQDKVKKKPVSGTVVASLRKGKVRELPKRKALSRLKRNILAIRGRRQIELAKEKSEDEYNKTPVVSTNSTVENNSPTTPNTCDSINYSRKFRSYCDHSNDPQLRNIAEDILRDLFRFQDRAYEKNQIKARAHRRYVVGFKEVTRCLDLNKVKLLFISTDMEASAGEGGIVDTVENIKKQCQVKDVPYCFPLQRRKIGYLLFKKAPIGCVAILDFSGAEDHVTKLLNLISNLRSILVPEMANLNVT